MPAYISEVDYDGGAASNFVEIAISSGIDTSGYTLVVYGSDGTVTATFSLGSPVGNTAGHNVYLIDDNDTGWIDLKNSDGLALVDDSSTVLQFISFKDPVTAVEGPANGTTSTAIGEHSGSSQSLVTSDKGASYSTTTTSTAGTIPVCFASGTLIATPDGPRPIETLFPGDPISTLDHGPVPVRWTRSSDVALEDDGFDTHPILIAASAFGLGTPSRDLIVSPQHRVLVGGHGQADGLCETPSFAPAKSLIGLPGIRVMKGKRAITWVHVACARHEVLIAHDCLSESLLLGPMAVSCLNGRERSGLRKVFGSPRQPAWNGSPARPCLRADAVRNLIRDWRPQARPRRQIELAPTA